MKTFIAAVRKHWAKVGVTFCIALAVVLLTNWLMIRTTRDQIFTNSATLPSSKVGLVLGTSPRLKNGALNWHFQVRIDAAEKLFREGKVEHLLLSGDNHTHDYDEPSEMKAALLKRGVPESAITLDYAGFRTLDSMARAKAVFGQDKVTIITEDFHANRSAFLARHFGLQAVVFCAEPLEARWRFRMEVRELGARCKAALDAYVLHTKPHFLGDKIEIKVEGNVTPNGRVMI